MCRNYLLPTRNCRKSLLDLKISQISWGYLKVQAFQGYCLISSFLQSYCFLFYFLKSYLHSLHRFLLSCHFVTAVLFFYFYTSLSLLFLSSFPEFKNTIETQITEVKTQIENNCSLQ